MGRYLLRGFRVFLRIKRQCLLLMLDFPVYQEGKYAAQQNDDAQYAKLAPFTDNDGTQNLAAHLEFKRQCDTLRQIQPNPAIALHPVPKALDCGKDKYGDAEQF